MLINQLWNSLKCSGQTQWVRKWAVICWGNPNPWMYSPCHRGSTLLKWSPWAKRYKPRSPRDHSNCPLEAGCPWLRPCRRLENLPEGQAVSLATANGQVMWEFEPIRTWHSPPHLQLPGRLSRDPWGSKALRANGGEGTLWPQPCRCTASWGHCASLPGLFFWITLCPAEGQGDCVRNCWPAWLLCWAAPRLLHHRQVVALFNIQQHVCGWTCCGSRARLTSTMSLQSEASVWSQTGLNRRVLLFQWSLILSPDVLCPSGSSCLTASSFGQASNLIS